MRRAAFEVPFRLRRFYGGVSESELNLATSLPSASRLLERACELESCQAVFTAVVERRVMRATLETRHGSGELFVEHIDEQLGLSTRELEVATAITAGKSNVEIAGLLYCSRSTVSTHIERILEKLGIRNRLEVALLVQRFGLITLPLDRDDEAAQTASDLILDLSRPRQGFSVAQVAKKRSIRIHALYPACEGQAEESAAMLRGAELAVDRSNVAGHDTGRGTLLLSSFVTPETLSTAIIEAVRSEPDAIMLGSFPARETTSAMVTASDWGGPILHSMVAPQLSRTVADSGAALLNVFQVAGTEIAYVRGFFRTLKDIVALGSWSPPRRRAVVVVRSTVWEVMSETMLGEISIEAGWQLNDYLVFTGGAEEVARIAARIAERRPEAVHLPIMSEFELSEFTAHLDVQDCHPMIYVDWRPSAPNFLERSGHSLEGVVWSTIVGAYTGPIARRFQADFRNKFDDDPGIGASAIHYDIVRVLNLAWSEMARPWDYARVLKVLRTAVVGGATGPIHFGGPGQTALSFPEDSADPSIAHTHLVFQIQGGRNRLIGPTGAAQYRFRPPAQHA